MTSFQDFQFNTSFASQFDINNTSLEKLRIDMNPVPSMRDTSRLVRAEKTPIYDFKAKGRYTTQFINSSNRPRSNLSSSGLGDFDLDNNSQNFCSTHKELKEFILYESIEDYQLYDTICKNCLSLLNFRKGGNSDYKSKLYDTVILDNRDKLIQIRNNKFESGGDSKYLEINDVLKETIMPLVDELMYISEVFQGEVSDKLGGGGCNSEHFLKIKDFVERECGDINGEISIKGIGKDVQKKNRLINLAVFLLKHLGNIKINVSKKGISDSLKSHLLRMVEIRKVIIFKITSWLRYLTGPIYDYIFSIEGVSVDENFRNNLQIDFISEEEIIRLKAFFEAELRKRDDKIKFLEEENARLRREIETYKDQDRLFNELRFKFSQLEGEYNNLKIQLSNVIGENQRLSKLNGEYVAQIEQFRRDISQMKIEFEQKFRSAIDQMKIEYEKKVNEMTNTFNSLKYKYSELENKYNIDVRTLQAEKETIINNMSIMKQKFESEVKMYREQIESLQKENNSIKITINQQMTQISQLTNERDQLKNTVDGLRIQISTLEANIKNLGNQLNILMKERDELRMQVNTYVQELNTLKIHLENSKNQISQLELNLKNSLNQISGITKERDELKHQLNLIIQERDNLRNQLENARSQLNIFEQNIKNLTLNANVLSKERDEARNQLIILRGELEKCKGEISIIQNIKITVEARYSELQKKYDEISEAFEKLKNEFNLKITIITNLEGKIRELNTTIANHKNEISLHLTSIKKLQEEFEELKKKYQELLGKDVIISQKDLEIENLKRALCDCREEWNKLSESYEGLFKDIRVQISINEALRMFIFELQGKIEAHNQQISGLDNAMKQQLEILMRQALSKKNIEYNQNSEAMRKTQNEVEVLKSKLGRIETQKLTQSPVFLNVDKILTNFDKNFTGKINIPLSPSVHSGDYMASGNAYNMINNMFRVNQHNIDLNINSTSTIEGFRTTGYGENVFKKVVEYESTSSIKKVDVSGNLSDVNPNLKKSKVASDSEDSN